MDYTARIKKLQKTLQGGLSEAILIEDPVNIYYLTGQDLSTGRLLVHLEGAHLFVDSRYYEKCKQNCSIPVELLASGTFADWCASQHVKQLKTLGFDSNTTTFKQYIEWGKSISEAKNFLQLVPLDNPCKALRRVKDSEEIALMKQAAKLGSEGYDYVVSLLKEGIAESEIAIELEIFWKRKGSKGLAFDPIIAFGSNSSMPHYRAGSTKLKHGQNVLIDIGVNLAHYHSDMTRVVFFGAPQPKILEIYRIVSEAQNIALKMCQPGTLIGDLDKAARDYIASFGYGEKFGHSLGHGVGLDIHESPTIKQKTGDSSLPLEEGMVITIEPGIYLEGLGGVRIEDTVVITKSGHENLTNRPKDVLHIDIG